MYVVVFHVVDVPLGVVVVIVFVVLIPGVDVLVVVVVQLVEVDGVLGIFVFCGRLSTTFMTCLAQGSSGLEHTVVLFTKLNL